MVIDNRRHLVYTKGMDKLYSVSETAQLLHISRGNLYRLIAEGTLKPIKLGKRTLFSERELEAFIEGLKRDRPQE
jgi:excisionase family DNA binding protein